MFNKKMIASTVLLLFLIVAGLIFLGKHQEVETAQDEAITQVQQKPIHVVDTYKNDITIETTEVEMIAKTIYGEARGSSRISQSAVAWCILNRVDAGQGTITEVITAPHQFVGYRPENPVKDEFAKLAEDVLIRWQMEKRCAGEVGRTLPKDYLYFHGDGKHNYFRNGFSGNYDTWNWDCWNPYE